MAVGRTLSTSLISQGSLEASCDVTSSYFTSFNELKVSKANIIIPLQPLATPEDSSYCLNKQRKPFLRIISYLGCISKRFFFNRMARKKLPTEDRATFWDFVQFKQDCIYRCVHNADFDFSICVILVVYKLCLNRIFSTRFLF